MVYATQGLDLAFVFPVINRDSGLAQDSLTSSTKCSKHLHNFVDPCTVLNDEELFVGPLRINECPIDFVSPVLMHGPGPTNNRTFLVMDCQHILQ